MKVFYLRMKQGVCSFDTPDSTHLNRIFFINKRIEKKKKKAIWDILVSFILKLKYSQSSRFWEDAREEEEQLHSSD